MARTVGLALAAAVYPTLLAGVIVILAQPRPRRLLLGFLLGGMTVSIIAGALIVAGIRASGRVVEVSRTTRPLIDITVGVISLLAARVIWRGRGPRLRVLERWRLRRAERSSVGWTQRVLGRDSLTLAVIAGALLNLPGLWYLAALGEIATVEPFSARVTQVLVFNLIMFVLVEVPLVLFVIDEDRAGELVGRGYDWALSHRREVASGVMVAVGALLIVRGLVTLG